MIRVMRDLRGFTLVELLVVIIVLGLGAALTVPAILRGRRNDRLAQCQSRLRSLWEAESAYRAREKKGPARLGSAYWAEVLGPGTDIALRTCPISDRLPYRGPAGDPSALPPAAPIGADAPGSHGEGEGGFLLLRNGEVRPHHERDGDWIMGAKILAP